MARWKNIRDMHGLRCFFAWYRLRRVPCPSHFRACVVFFGGVIMEPLYLLGMRKQCAYATNRTGYIVITTPQPQNNGWNNVLHRFKCARQTFVPVAGIQAWQTTHPRRGITLEPSCSTKVRSRVPISITSTFELVAKPGFSGKTRLEI